MPLPSSKWMFKACAGAGSMQESAQSGARLTKLTKRSRSDLIMKSKKGAPSKSAIPRPCKRRFASFGARLQIRSSGPRVTTASQRADNNLLTVTSACDRYSFLEAAQSQRSKQSWKTTIETVMAISSCIRTLTNSRLQLTASTVVSAYIFNAMKRVSENTMLIPAESPALMANPKNTRKMYMDAGQSRITSSSTSQKLRVIQKTLNNMQMQWTARVVTKWDNDDMRMQVTKCIMHVTSREVVLVSSAFSMAMVAVMAIVITAMARKCTKGWAIVSTRRKRLRSTSSRICLSSWSLMPQGQHKCQNHFRMSAKVCLMTSLADFHVKCMRSRRHMKQM
mmetsp:Transcript_49484/g.105792  ORF Transcript_49484/g.105792 Transcript_49484/m.105792 type:complete len:336 (+) Transcript_49484:1184-2191(+)